ncbi:PAP2 superfamily protein [Pseudomonas sp. ok272]|uniref:phosphatase PAP2 family protein n=1 Tax=unclassified Pseudomonas TaxID=196821 RepID=UPI0008C373FF|nr:MULTISPECIES: phosphatase PAP2 family protein [unclassified Pseudomonas]SEM48868.1 PAP2 superfamily protein [Pseudomonas sp. ok272]SFM20442.1 PAP2 superfamily protein [Pseudomonas sp. ok602]
MIKAILPRLWHMLLGWGCVGLVYNLTDRFQGTGTVISPSLIDRLIPFSPHAIWLYLSFFILIPLAYLLAPMERVKPLARAMQLTAIGAGAVYLAWPTTMVYPLDHGTTLSSAVLGALAQFDSKQNCLPSLHMALTVLAVWALGDARHTLRTVLLIAWAVAIGFSILQLRRHLLIDLVSGALLALVAAGLARRLDVSRYRALRGEV